MMLARSNLAETHHTEVLANDILLEHTPKHLHLALPTPHTIMSSAILGGGLTAASHLLNLRVAKDSPNISSLDTPQTTLTNYCRHNNWRGNYVGMMTAASMKSLRIAHCEEQGITLTVLVTSGINNARCAGDPADWPYMTEQPSIDTTEPIGTINTIILCSATLTPTVMTEAIITATEAKTVALRKLNIKSKVSEEMATGTGTDAIAIVSGEGSKQIDYFGKHVIAGEHLAKLIISATMASIDYKNHQAINRVY